MDNEAKSITEIFTLGGGEFLLSSEKIQEHLFQAQVFLFDWDGVFTDGRKDKNKNSCFSELDLMGINMLRFSWFLRTGSVPFTAIITGEENPNAMHVAERDRFNAVYFQVKNKSVMRDRLLRDFGVKTSEALFFMDDVLDMAFVGQCLLGFAIGNRSAPLFRQLLQKQSNCAYISANTGGNHGLREVCELILGLITGVGGYDSTIKNRIEYSTIYQQFIEKRNETQPTLFAVPS